MELYNKNSTFFSDKNKLSVLNHILEEYLELMPIYKKDEFGNTLKNARGVNIQAHNFYKNNQNTAFAFIRNNLKLNDLDLYNNLLFNKKYEDKVKEIADYIKQQKSKNQNIHPNYKQTKLGSIIGKTQLKKYIEDINKKINQMVFESNSSNKEKLLRVVYSYLFKK